METHDLYDDYPQGYYADGAYTATPLPSSTTQLTQRDGKQEEDEDTQEAYYVSLCNRFAELTETLQSPAPSTAPNRTNVYNLDWRTRRVWRGKVLNTAPTMVILSQLSQESVVCGLGVLEAELTFRTLARGEGKKIGAWAWGLLGRCREVGQMGSEEVGVLRKLAKKAIWLLRRISAGEMFGGENDEPNMDDGEGIAEDVNDEEGQGGREDEAAGASDAEDSIGDFTPNIDPVSLAVLHHDGHTPSPPSTGNSEAAIAEAKKRVLNSMGAIDQTQDEFMGAELKNGAVLEPTTSIQPDRTTETGEREDPGDKVDVKASIFATLDMLVTIIGEFYGQKDLLGGRILWDEMQ